MWYPFGYGIHRSEAEDGRKWSKPSSICPRARTGEDAIERLYFLAKVEREANVANASPLSCGRVPKATGIRTQSPATA